jgi:hypothetical protein
MAQRLLHRGQDMGVAAASTKISRSASSQLGRATARTNQPAQAPDDHALCAHEDLGEENRRRRIVGRILAPRDLVRRAAREVHNLQTANERFRRKPSFDGSRGNGSKVPTLASGSSAGGPR